MPRKKNRKGGPFVAGSSKRFQKKGNGKFQSNKQRVSDKQGWNQSERSEWKSHNLCYLWFQISLAIECPKIKQTQKNKDSDDEKVFLTFASSCARLESECYGKGNIDTACTSSEVAGINWYKSFVGKLPDFFQKQLKTVAGTSFIEFGGGEKIKVLFSCRLPIMLSDLNCFLNVSVIRSPLPLLISVKSLVAAKVSQLGNHVDVYSRIFEEHRFADYVDRPFGCLFVTKWDAHF